jgi:hypothetical protein
MEALLLLLLQLLEHLLINMAHFAEIDSNNIVLRVIVIDNQDVNNNGGDQSIGAESFVANLVGYSSTGVRWVQTSYNNNFRGKYAGLGMKYDNNLNRFIPSQPFLSWTFDSNTFEWNPPIPYPETYSKLGEPFKDIYFWNEDNKSWVLSN